jgi:hypothetical protein
MVSNSGDYLQAVFPIAPNQFLNQPLALPFLPNILSFSPTYIGAEADAINLWLDGMLLTAFQAERIIGIVPGTWFTFHKIDPGCLPQNGCQVDGVAFPEVNACFVTNNMPLVTPHELGRTYGIPHTYSGGDPGPTTSGFWVARREEVPSSIDYMGASPGVVRYPGFGSQRWSRRDTFERLFRQFRTQKEDPEVLLVTGTFSQTAEVSFGPVYRALNGTFSEPETSGDAVLRVLDITFQAIAELPFAFDFRAFPNAREAITLDQAPFAFAVPYPRNAFRVEVVRGGKILAGFNITSKLLRDAVAAIPDKGFVSNPSGLRNALLNKIDALDSILTSGDVNGAWQKLRSDIRPSLTNWLQNNYQTQSPRQYTKSQILNLVDEMLRRLLGG